LVTGHFHGISTAMWLCELVTRNSAWLSLEIYLVTLGSLFAKGAGKYLHQTECMSFKNNV